jgi:hypothetical protein
MSLNLDHNYEQKLRMAKPTQVGGHVVHPPVGALGAPSLVPPLTIPPVNTDIQFDSLPKFKLSEHPGLADMQTVSLPTKFNWIDDGGEKSKWISRPGNQMLCGSCWAISSASTIADNYVVSGIVDYKPDLSTTWNLACYPQAKCQGGNPALLLQNIQQKGIADVHCIDYSWCATNDNCNGLATKHFKESEEVNLSQLIPPCGCYNSDEKHYLYYIDKISTVSIGDLTQEAYVHNVKSHIYKYGPVLGGFLVFKNFMSGAFAKVNNGIYLENGIYDQGAVHFQEGYPSSDTYVGSHAVSVIGWGEAEVVYNNKGDKTTVPYWECVNSWTPTWGNSGRFKMAMYPYNKISQFDKVIDINTNDGTKQGGGMILLNITSPPKLENLPQLDKTFVDMKKLETASFYKGEQKDTGGVGGGPSTGNVGKYILLAVIFLVVIFLVFVGIMKLYKHFSSSAKTGRSGSYRF